MGAYTVWSSNNIFLTGSESLKPTAHLFQGCINMGFKQSHYTNDVCIANCQLDLWLDPDKAVILYEELGRALATIRELVLEEVASE